MINDALIMPFITSANIACGYHAGDDDIMRETIQLAMQNHVHIGAHPSFPDKENFGRTEMNLTMDEIYKVVTYQVQVLANIAEGLGQKLHHVKPHGALYNMSARDENIARSIAESIRDFDPSLILFGLSGSVSIREAKKAGLKTMSEVFADRTYQDDGSLTSRKQPNAMIENVHDCIEQVRSMIKNGVVYSVNGNAVPILAETICVHGDGENALAFVRAIRESTFI